MTDNCRKKASEISVVLLSVVILLLIVPVGISVGTFLGLISNFGLSYTVENARLNPEIFADQFAGHVVYGGWIALVCLAAAFVLIGILIKAMWRGKEMHVVGK